MTDPTSGQLIEREAITLFEAMLDVPEEARDAWILSRTAGRATLFARLSAMRDADRRAQLRTGTATDTLDEEVPPERIGAYRVVGLIGRGGMGSVYLGERMTDDFRHSVAIKIIKPGLMSKRLIERFRNERQTLAQLSHPSIAQLYDGGETEGGAPYIVMEHVDGVPLLQWAATSNASLHERRRLFREICTAVGFAHRSLIVHRDLTPSNVLVTRDGSAKLIDFGIARPTDAAGERTDPQLPPSLASLSLTPGYAAPERTTSAAVTTAADIYSLGKLLAKLIPAKDDLDLSAIVARATADDPLARYPTADALGDDVEAWASGFPVAAREGGRGYRVCKYVSRHRIGVALATIATLLLVTALAVTLFANVRAERARDIAERRFQQTRSIAKTLLFDVYDEVSRSPGSTRARAMLARTGLRYLDALAQDTSAPLDVRIETARGYTRLAEVTGSGQESQLGNAADADTLLARSAAILVPAYAAHPKAASVVRAYAALLTESAGIALHNNNNADLARTQAIRAQRLLADMKTRDADFARIYVLAIMTEADSHGWNDDYATARLAHLRAEQAAASLPPPLRRDRRVMAARASNLRLLGEAHHKLTQEEDARRILDRAVTVDRQLLALEPDSPAALRRLTAVLWYSAVVHRTNKRDQQARAASAEALELARRQRDRDPADAGALKLVAYTGEVYAQVLADLGQFGASNAIGEEVTAAQREMVRRSGGAPGTIRSMTAALSTRGGNYYNGGYYTEACAIWREALVNFATLERRGQLTETDRRNGYPELRTYIAKSCENGPPRAGLGPKM